MPSRPWQQMSQVPEVACEFAFPNDPMFQRLRHLGSCGMELPICELGGELALVGQRLSRHKLP